MEHYLEPAFDAALNQGLWDEALNIIDEIKGQVDEARHSEMKIRLHEERYGKTQV